MRPPWSCAWGEGASAVIPGIMGLLVNARRKNILEA